MNVEEIKLNLADVTRNRDEWMASHEALRQRLMAVYTEIDSLVSAGEKIGAWLSAAIDDPVVCVEMKQDADRFLHALDPFLGGLFSGSIAACAADCEGEA